MTQQEIIFQILEQTISVKTTLPKLKTVLAQMYGRFLLSASSMSEADPTFRYIQNLTLGEANREPENASILDVSRLLRTYAAGAQSHLLLHAGVLSLRGQGILIVAPSMHGKTTLTLNLLRRGLRFLSDDIAALSLYDELIYPFPRALVIRPGSLSLAGFSALPVETPTWLGKQIIDVEALCPGSISEPVPIRHIFFLHEDDPKRLYNQASLNAIPSCSILLSELTTELFREIEGVEGVEELTISEFDNQPYLTVYAHNRPHVLQQIEALCQRHQVDLFHLAYRIPRKPDFHGPVALEKISQNQATMLLLQQFLGGYHSALLKEELGNSPARLSMTLARMIRDANCYQLSVGSLQDMADTVCAAVGFETPTE